LAARLAATDPVDGRLLAAWRRLQGAGGAVSVAALADEVDWSRRHLAVRFRREFGLPPKTVARLLRFERAYASLGRTLDARPAAGPPAAGWAERAARWGYYDQSHLIREFQEFAGATPAALVRAGSHSSNPG
ncbi:helix-turn-helix domain-containing protein, partial [Micromonospora maritima]